MNLHPAILILLLLVGFLFSSCTRTDMIRGKGSTATRTLTLPPFHSVESHYDIAAHIHYGTTQKVEASGYENLLDILDFSVENQVLKLKFNTQYSTIRNVNVVAHISLPTLESAVIHGSNSLDITGFRQPGLATRIHGSGTIRIDQSRTENFRAAIHGSGNVEAEGLNTREARISVHGSGRTRLRVDSLLEVDIQGSGDVYYLGNPRMQTRINGSGRVIKRT